MSCGNIKNEIFVFSGSNFYRIVETEETVEWIFENDLRDISPSIKVKNSILISGPDHGELYLVVQSRCELHIFVKQISNPWMKIETTSFSDGNLE